jgi:hypothetical protein
MQYLINVIFDETSGEADDAEAGAIDAFNDRLRADGHWVFANGLASPEASTTIDNRAGKGLVTDGPFAETKEWAAGLWIIEAADLDVALALATEASSACNRKVELRPCHG